MIIKTKYLGATTYKGARISVNVDGVTKIYPYQYKYNCDENHFNAGYKALADLGKGNNRQYYLNKAFKNGDYKSTNTGYIYNI